LTSSTEQVNAEQVNAEQENSARGNRLPRVPVILLLIVLGLITWIWKQIPSLGEEDAFASNLGVVLLINANIILVMVLGFIVIRNVVKLVLDRRRGILGSRLRSRLVTAFVGLSLIPTALLFLVAKGIVEQVLEDLFSPQVEAAVDGALNVSRSHYALAEKQLVANVHSLGKLLGQVGLGSRGEIADDAFLRALIEGKRQEYSLSEVLLVAPDGRVLLRAAEVEPDGKLLELPGPQLGSLYRALRGESIATPEQSVAGEYLRAYGRVDSTQTVAVAGEPLPISELGVVATLVVPEPLVEGLEQVIGAYDDYKELRTNRRPLASSYLLALVIVTLLVVFAAIWVGFFLARSLSGPVQQLASGTVAVAQGDLDYQIPDVGDDELSVLVKSFNKMTSDLKATTGELVSRRRYMETVLESVNVGVVSIDRENLIATFNLAAAEILGVEQPKLMQGRALREIMPRSFSEQISGLVLELNASVEKALSVDVTLEHQGETKQLVVTMTKLMNDRAETVGTVILLDDLTALVSAQRMAAWREVARRIAHEIKNPLTPIQLSAQRIQRRFATATGRLATEELKVISEGTDVIVKQVDALRNLIDEFSRFARMPQVNLTPCRLNEIVDETIQTYQEILGEVQLSVELDPEIPLIELDREQIARVLVNLLDNALASARERQLRLEAGYQARVAVRSRYSPTLGLVALEVADNGVGVPDPDKARLFEPYFSRRKGGTGLGLAIVNTIVADHNGFIRVRDNEGGGALFIVELPVSRRALRGSTG